jgi:hypothetical protein
MNYNNYNELYRWLMIVAAKPHLVFERWCCQAFKPQPFALTHATGGGPRRPNGVEDGSQCVATMDLVDSWRLVNMLINAVLYGTLAATCCEMLRNIFEWSPSTATDQLEVIKRLSWEPICNDLS